MTSETSDGFKELLERCKKKHIVLKDGAPPLDQLHMELRVRNRVTFDVSNYRSDSDYVPHIGKEASNLVEAANEERLLLLVGDTSEIEMLNLYDATVIEEGDDSEVDSTRKALAAHFQFVLVDEAGTVWSELVHKADSNNNEEIKA